jgi:5-formyltetrahydrofolate cyclo-ligase
MFLSTSAIRRRKSILRAEALDKRRANADTNKERSLKLAEVFLKSIRLEEGAVVGSYFAFREEMDPSALNDILRGQGHKIAFPVVVEKDKNRRPLVFRIYEQGDGLLLNSYGIPEPGPDAQKVRPDVLLVPLLAFDSQRYRLGYGKGYYDITLKNLRAHKPVVAIGIAYDYQKVDELLPVRPHDVRMSKIVTDINVY